MKKPLLVIVLRGIKFVEKHHYYGEEHLFHAIEKAIGVRGVMDHEIAGHRKSNDALTQNRIYNCVGAFERDLLAFKSHLENLRTHKISFQSSRILEMMDSFSDALCKHLISEPKAIVALSRFSTPDNPIDIASIALGQGKKQVTIDFTLNVMPVFLLNMEIVDFEDGRWRKFPPVYGLARWILKSLIPMWNHGRWRFASCSSDGKRKWLAV